MTRSQGSEVQKKKTSKKTKKELRPPLFFWSASAKQFEKKVKEFGYIGDDGGMCHGVACVAAHAMLLNQVDQFDRDLLQIRDSRLEEDRAQYRERTLLEAVELCHHPCEYPALFSVFYRNPNVTITQQAMISIPLIESVDISAQGGVVSVAKFSGVYNRSELIECLKLIRKGIEKFPCPTSLLLSDEKHIIAVQYNPAESSWFFVDIRRLPSRRFECEEDLARAIANSLTPNLKKTVMSGLILSTRKNEAIAKKAFVYTARLRDWKKIQGIDETKNRYLKRWLFVAAYEGCEKEVAFLLSHQVNPNQPIINGDTPLTIAARQGNEGVVKLLLSYGALVNSCSKYTASPLYTALCAGNDNIATVLRMFNAKLKKDEYAELELSA